MGVKGLKEWLIKWDNCFRIFFFDDNKVFGYVGGISNLIMKGKYVWGYLYINYCVNYFWCLVFLCFNCFRFGWFFYVIDNVNMF